MVIEKAKRHPQSSETSYLPLHIARILFVTASVYTLVALLQIESLYSFYATIAGIMMWFYWVIIAGSLFIGMSAQWYQMHGAPIKAKAARMTLFAIAVMSTGAFSVAIGGF